MTPALPPEKAQADHFTTEWNVLDISFERDVSNHRHFPQALENWRYVIKFGVPATGSIGFEAARYGDFKVFRGRSQRERGISRTIELPDGEPWTAPGGVEVGAYDEGQIYPGPKYLDWSKKP